MTGATRLLPVVIPGPAGDLEALVQEREGAPRLIAVVCHPHPLYGGTLHNKVVHRVASVLHELGAAVVRFNFRGAGKSAGVHDRGVGELEDARAALRWIEQRHPGVPRWVAGFSFGAWIAARLAADEREIERLILIAPAVRTSSFETMHTATVPKLVVQGTADVTCPLANLQQEFPNWAEPKQLVLIEGGTHFFDRQLAALGDALRRELQPLVV